MILFQRLEEKYFVTIQKWFIDDEAGMKFLSSYSKPESYAQLIDFNKKFFWVVLEDEQPIGFLEFEIESAEMGYIVFYIAPEFRNQGLANRILRESLVLSDVRQVRVIEAGVEEDNYLSIKVLEKNGFVYSYKDEDNMLMYQLRF